MSVYELVFTRGAQSEYAALDGSVRNMVDKGLARLRVRPDEIGKQLSGRLLPAVSSSSGLTAFA